MWTIFDLFKSQHHRLAVAAIAQLGERQTEDLKVPGSIPGLGIIYSFSMLVPAHAHAFETAEPSASCELRCEQA
jgi:hypothetical protein